MGNTFTVIVCQLSKPQYTHFVREELSVQTNWFHEHPLLMLSHRIYLVLKEGKSFGEKIL